MDSFVAKLLYTADRSAICDEPMLIAMGTQEYVSK